MDLHQQAAYYDEDYSAWTNYLSALHRERDSGEDVCSATVAPVMVEHLRLEQEQVRANLELCRQESELALCDDDDDERNGEGQAAMPAALPAVAPQRAIDDFDMLLPPEPRYDIAQSGVPVPVRVGTLKLNGVSVKFEANYHAYLVGKNCCIARISLRTNTVTIEGSVPTGAPGADVWHDMPVEVCRQFLFNRVELHNGSRLEFSVPHKHEHCLDEVFTRGRESRALEFWLDDECSVINMPTLDNDMGGSQRTVAVSLGRGSIFTGKSGSSVDHLRLHVRAPQAELKSYFVKVSATGTFDAVHGVKVLLGVLQTCACRWTINAPGKRASSWRPRVTQHETAPRSAERQAASQKDSRQTLTYRIEAWFRKCQARIDSLHSAVEHSVPVVDALLSLPDFPDVPSQWQSLASRYADDAGEAVVDFEKAKHAYEQKFGASSAIASSSSSSEHSQRGSKRSLDVESSAEDVLLTLDAGGSPTPTIDTSCMVCQMAPAVLFGKRCGHAYYCAECDVLSRAKLSAHAYLACPLCRLAGQALVGHEHVDKHHSA